MKFKKNPCSCLRWVFCSDLKFKSFYVRMRTNVPLEECKLTKLKIPVGFNLLLGLLCHNCFVHSNLRNFSPREKSRGFAF
jgi:hypothetical protein